MAKSREIVFYHEQHTLMTQDVTVLINEKVLKEMLVEELTEEVKRELIQSYYVCKLDKELKIASKEYYGAWNASIGDIKKYYNYENEIIEKIKGQITIDDLENNFKIINKQILQLSENEDFNSTNIQKEIIKTLGINKKVPKI